MAFGTLYHSFLLEPADFLKQAAVLDAVMKHRLYEEALAAKSKAKGFSKSLGTYKAWKLACDLVGAQVVDEKTVLKMENMREQLFRDTEIAYELAAVTHSETSIYFGMPAEGTAMKAPYIQCKARLDMHYPGVIGDLKTCRSAHPLEFAREIPKLGYDTQMAWYRMGARCAGLDVSRCFLLAQESTFPYLPALHWMPDEWIDYARKEVMRVYLQFAACVRDNRYPGYGNGELLPPAWLQDAIEAGG